jgi:hypothetical protein
VFFQSEYLINSVVIEYKSIFDFNVKLQTLQNFLQTIELMARLLGSDYAQAAVNQDIINEVIIPRIKTNLKHIVNCLLITLKVLFINSSLLSEPKGSTQAIARNKFR